MSKKTITSQQVQHIAQLANLTLDDQQLQTFPTAFSNTLDVIDQLQELDVKNVEPTHQVTGLENVLREDVVREDFMFTQAQALANAPKTYQGFFVVPQLISKD